VGVGRDGETQFVRGDVRSTTATHVAANGEAREVAHGSARHKRAARSCGHARETGNELQGLILGHHDAGGFEPTGAVKSGARDHHVEEQGILGGGVGNKREEPGRVDGDHRDRELLFEEAKYFAGVVAFSRDETIKRVLGNGYQTAEVERHRIHGQTFSAVVKNSVREGGVILIHLVAHWETFRLNPYYRRTWAVSMKFAALSFDGGRSRILQWENPALVT
jgi:hypothetical protein